MNTTEKKITFSRAERKNSMPTQTEIKQANPDVLSVKDIEITATEFVVTVNVEKAVVKAKKTTKAASTATTKTSAKKTTAKKTTAKSRLTKTVTSKKD